MKRCDMRGGASFDKRWDGVHGGRGLIRGSVRQCVPYDVGMGKTATRGFVIHYATHNGSFSSDRLAIVLLQYAVSVILLTLRCAPKS